MKSSPRAFTLIELMIAILIIAVLSAALMLNFSSASQKALFDDQITNIVRVIEQARSYSLTNYLVNDTEPTEYYLLTIGADYLSIEAYADYAGTHDSLEEYELDTGFTTTATDDEVFYIPPYGQVCLEYPCVDGGDTEYPFVVSNSDGSLSQVITITTHGGFAELE